MVLLTIKTKASGLSKSLETLLDFIGLKGRLHGMNSEPSIL
jgi:hypothetical protein